MNGDDFLKKEYGPHAYEGEGTSDCGHDCGCWAGDSRSGGPLGLDPISGKCPNNPVDGDHLPGKQDYENVVKQRIYELEQRLYKAADELRRTSPAKKKLAEDLRKAKTELFERDQTLRQIRELVAEPVR